MQRQKSANSDLVDKTSTILRVVGPAHHKWVQCRIGRWEHTPDWCWEVWNRSGSNESKTDSSERCWSKKGGMAWGRSLEETFRSITSCSWNGGTGTFGSRGIRISRGSSENVRKFSSLPDWSSREREKQLWTKWTVGLRLKSANGWIKILRMMSTGERARLSCSNRQERDSLAARMVLLLHQSSN